MTFSTRSIQALWLACVLLLASLLPWWAWNGYPLSEPDALWFLPASVALKQGKGLHNTLHPPAMTYDASKQGRFAFYPPGMPLLVSSLLPEATGRGALTVLSLFCGLAWLGLGLVLIRWVRDWSSAGLALTGMLAVGTYFSSFNLGRPDFLATLLYTLLFCCAWSWRSLHSAWVCGLILGFIAFVHPVGALLASALLGCLQSWKNQQQWRGVLVWMCICCSVGILVFCVAMYLSPFGWENYWKGIVNHAQCTLSEGTLGDRYKNKPFKYLVWHSYATGYVFVFLCALGAWIHSIVASWKHLSWKWGVLIFTLIFCFFAYWFVGRAWDRAYNLWQFVPLYIVLIVAMVEDLPAYLKPYPRTALIVLFLGCSIGFGIRLMGWVDYCQSKFHYSNMRAEFNSILAEHPQASIGVSKSLWVLGEEYHRMKSYGYRTTELQPQPDILFLQQRYTKYQQAPELQGYTKIIDHFQTQRFDRNIRKLITEPVGYQYAVYKKTNSLE